MNTALKKSSPYLLILLGLFLLFYLGQAIPAGVFFLIGTVMIINRLWPEKWGSETN